MTRITSCGLNSFPRDEKITTRWKLITGVPGVNRTGKEKDGQRCRGGGFRERRANSGGSFCVAMQCPHMHLSGRKGFLTSNSFRGTWFALLQQEVLPYGLKEEAINISTISVRGQSVRTVPKWAPWMALRSFSNAPENMLLDWKLLLHFDWAML